MKTGSRVWMIGAGVAAAVAACDPAPEVKSDPSRIEAGAASQALQVQAYKTERVGESRLIHLLGFADREIGTVELTPVKAGEIGFDDLAATPELLARNPQIRVRYETEKAQRDVSLLRGRERPGIDCPQNSPPPHVLPTDRWSAALSDPALAPFIDELELEVEVDDPNAFPQALERPFADNCQGHRVNSVDANYHYSSCYAPNQNQWITYLHNTDARLYCQVYRECYGSTADGGNGFLSGGWQSCCNIGGVDNCSGSGGSCENPSQAGATCRVDCAGFGGAGCKINSGPNFYCGATACESECYNNCGDYDQSCCTSSMCGGSCNGSGVLIYGNCYDCYMAWYSCTMNPSQPECSCLAGVCY